MTKLERGDLVTLIATWNAERCYADDPEYAEGYEAGMQNAAYELEEFLRLSLITE